MKIIFNKNAISDLYRSYADKLFDSRFPNHDCDYDATSVFINHLLFNMDEMNMLLAEAYNTLKECRNEIVSTGESEGTYFGGSGEHYCPDDKAAACMYKILELQEKIKKHAVDMEK